MTNAALEISDNTALVGFGEGCPNAQNAAPAWQRRFM
jgi:hypothetical protein